MRRHTLRGILICATALFCLLCVILATQAKAYEGGRITTRRQDALHEAAEILRGAGFHNDSDALTALQRAWWEEQEKLDIVARVVMGEAGACPWLHQVAVAAVVVNRIASPLFPDTAREVVSAPMQYTTAYLRDFDSTSRQCYEAAKKAIDGESGVPADVVFQAEFVQGTGIWWTSEVDTGWYRSTTYFCRQEGAA